MMPLINPTISIDQMKRITIENKEGITTVTIEDKEIELKPGSKIVLDNGTITIKLANKTATVQKMVKLINDKSGDTSEIELTLVDKIDGVVEKVENGTIVVRIDQSVDVDQLVKDINKKMSQSLE